MASPFKVILITCILGFLGVLLVPKLIVQLNPTIKVPTIQVYYNWPNSSSYAMERQITSLLESGFSTIRGLENIESRSSKGSGYITLTFSKKVSFDAARFQVSTIIRQLYPKFPERASYPQIGINLLNDREDQNAFQIYSISAPMSSNEILQNVKNKIEPYVGAIRGIDKTLIHGANEFEWVINYSATHLQTLNISKTEIIRALQYYYEVQSLGQVNLNNQYINVSKQPDLDTINWKIPIKKVGNRIIYLTDVAAISQQEQEASRYLRINGNNTITYAIYAKKGENTLVLAGIVEEEINKISKTLPHGFEIRKTFDNTLFIKKELSQIYNRTIYTVLILLLFVLIISRSLRYLFLIVVSIVATLCIAFLLYYIFNVEIQLYSLAGITISLGLIIDNIIVMINHINTQRNLRAFLPILGSTLTTIGALSIIYFLEEELKFNLISFAYVIIINLSVSLFIALFFVPAIMKKISLPKRPLKNFIKIQEKFYEIYDSLIRFLVRQKKWVLMIAILLFGIPFFLLPQKLDSNRTLYHKSYNHTLGNEWYRENVRPFID